LLLFFFFFFFFFLVWSSSTFRCRGTLFHICIYCVIGLRKRGWIRKTCCEIELYTEGLHVRRLWKLGANFIQEKAMKAQRGSRGIALPFDLGARWGGWSTPHPRRVIPRKSPVSIVQKDGWTPGPVWTGAENLLSTSLFPPVYLALGWHCVCVELRRLMSRPSPGWGGICPSAALSIRNATSTALKFNPSLRGEKPVTMELPSSVVYMIVKAASALLLSQRMYSISYKSETIHTLHEYFLRMGKRGVSEG
jgi:hypothetical protein